MQIRTEQDMRDFCRLAKGPFTITIKPSPNADEMTVVNWQLKNCEKKLERKLSVDSHLQQGIGDISYEEGVVTIVETPYLYPSPRILTEDRSLTGPTNGQLLNAYDPENKTFLFHMRGRDIAAPFGFQAAAAGMSVYGEHPFNTALYRELIEEEGSSFLVPVAGKRAIDILDFMKGGENGVPQPLFNFGFFYDGKKPPALLNPVLSSMDQVAAYEQSIKEGISEGSIRRREAYHFHIPTSFIGEFIGAIVNRDPTQTGKNGGFYGPIPQSHGNFVRYLTDSKQLE